MHRPLSPLGKTEAPLANLGRVPVLSNLNRLWLGVRGESMEKHVGNGVIFGAEKGRGIGSVPLERIMPRDFCDHMDTVSIEFGRPVHESAGSVGISAAGCDGDGEISRCAG